MARCASFLALLLAVSGGCSMNRMVANNIGATMTDMRTAFYAEESPQHGFYGGPAQLKMLDGFLEAAPNNIDNLLSAAELNCGFALTFLDMSDPEWAAHLYRKGLGYALRALDRIDGELAAAVRAADAEATRQLLGRLDSRKLPAVFWGGVCWGGLMNATQDVHVAVDLPVVETMLAACVESNPDYFFAAGYAFFGMLYAGRAEMLGGDLEKGRAFFEKAIAATNGTFLLSKVLFARSYAVNKQDVALFIRLLTEVAEDAGEDARDRRLPNAVARRDARMLLARVGDFFPGYSGKDAGEPEVEPLEEEDDVDLDLN